MIRAVEVPTFIVGKTQSGKTWRAYRLFEAHEGPAIFADVQWQSYGEADVEVVSDPRRPGSSVAEIVDAFSRRRPGDRWPHVRWLPDLTFYEDELRVLVDYFKDVHRTYHLRGRRLPTLAIFMDEIWRTAPVWADARNPAVRVFTEGLQHRIVGVGLSQWPAQTSRLIGGNSYAWLIYHLNPKELADLNRVYHLEAPSWEWVADLGSRHYWKYDGYWWRGDENGLEVRVEEAVPLQPSHETGVLERGARHDQIGEIPGEEAPGKDVVLSDVRDRPREGTVDTSK